MSVPMIGPGPLEGGPKGSPGPARNAESFSACLKEQCGRESAPAETPEATNSGLANRVKRTNESGSAPSSLPENGSESTPEATSGSTEQAVGDVPKEPDIVRPPRVSLEGVVDLLVVSPNPDLVPEGKPVPFLCVSCPSDKADPVVAERDESSEDDKSAPEDLTLMVNSASLPLAQPIPLPVVAMPGEIPPAVDGPKPDQPLLSEGSPVETVQDNGAIGAVSRLVPASSPEPIAPPTEKRPTQVGPIRTADRERPESPELSIPPSEESAAPQDTAISKGFLVIQEMSAVSSASHPAVPKNSEPSDPSAFTKPDPRISRELGATVSVQAPLPDLKKTKNPVDQDAAFREGFKAVLDKSLSSNEAGLLVSSAESPVSSRPIEKASTAESVRPAGSVPVLNPSPVDLARQIHVHLESGRSVVHVELHPEHLGELSIALEAKGKDVSMQFTVDNDTARHSVTAGLKELSGTLTTLGWTVNGLAVQVASGGVGNGRSDADGTRWAVFSTNNNQVPLEQKAESRPASSGAWRVDLVA